MQQGTVMMCMGMHACGYLKEELSLRAMPAQDTALCKLYKHTLVVTSLISTGHRHRLLFWHVCWTSHDGPLVFILRVGGAHVVDE